MKSPPALAASKQAAPLLAVLLFATVASGVAHAVDQGPSHGAAEEEVHVESDAQIRGIGLGEFRIRAYYPVEAQKSTVRFTLFAAVDKEHFAEAREVAKARQHKLRDEIITVTRMAPLTIFDEAELADFRRRIVVRLRRAVPQLPLDDVYVSEFLLTVKSL